MCLSISPGPSCVNGTLQRPILCGVPFVRSPPVITYCAPSWAGCGSGPACSTTWALGQVAGVEVAAAGRAPQEMRGLGSGPRRRRVAGAECKRARGFGG
jgi:hypothetical protein